MKLAEVCIALFHNNGNNRSAGLRMFNVVEETDVTDSAGNHGSQKSLVKRSFHGSFSLFAIQ